MFTTIRHINKYNSFILSATRRDRHIIDLQPGFQQPNNPTTKKNDNNNNNPNPTQQPNKPRTSATPILFHNGYEKLCKKRTKKTTNKQNSNTFLQKIDKKTDQKMAVIINAQHKKKQTKQSREILKLFKTWTKQRQQLQTQIGYCRDMFH